MGGIDMTYLVYDDETKAQTDADQIYINWLSAIATQHEGRIKTHDMQEVYFSELTREEKLNLRIYGFHKGERVYNKGVTVKASVPQKVYNQNKWFIKKFSEYMSGVTDYIEEKEQIPSEWLNPIDEE